MRLINSKLLCDGINNIRSITRGKHDAVNADGMEGFQHECCIRPDLVGKHDYSCQFVVNSDSYHRRFSGYTLA